MENAKFGIQNSIEYRLCQVNSFNEVYTAGHAAKSSQNLLTCRIFRRRNHFSDNLATFGKGDLRQSMIRQATENIEAFRLEFGGRHCDFRTDHIHD